MHSAISSRGPVFYALWFFALAVFGLSLYVFRDAVRRRPSDFDGLREGKWFYAVPQGLYFLTFAVSLLPGVLTARGLSWIAVSAFLASPIAFAQQAVYLLRVAFPSRDRLEKRLAASGSAPQEDEPGEEE